MSTEGTAPADLAAGLRAEEERRSLGMIVFLASEGMLFSGMFALYAAGRMRHPHAFAHGVAGNLRWLGSTNTYLLLTSSWCIAMAVERLRAGRPRTALLLMLATMALGVAFLGLKGYEYRDHLLEGKGPVAVGHDEPGLALFMVLYWLMTGTHALHVIAGLILLAIMAWSVHRRRATPSFLELGAWYWHLVDLVWVFLWPLFYLLLRAPT